MSNNYFRFRQFTIHQDRCAMKVTTDACLFGAWTASKIKKDELRMMNCLDIGTGTGLLSLMLAQKVSQANFDSIEIDQDAFEQASKNIAGSPWGDRIKAIHADVRNFSFPHEYDIIISNPPFYENELKGNDKKKNIAHHGDDLSMPALLSVIKDNLSSKGTFYLLLPYKRNEEIKKLLLLHDLSVLQMIFIRQSPVHDYFRIMLEGRIKAVNPVETIIDEITIRDDLDQYTDAFKMLLKDYYLHL